MFYLCFFVFEMSTRNSNETVTKHSDGTETVTKTYTYTLSNGKTTMKRRSYVRNSTRPPRENQQNHKALVDYCSDLSNVAGKTYKSIVADFNRLHHTNYRLGAVFEVLHKIDPKRREAKRIITDKLIEYIKKLPNDDTVTESDHLRSFNKTNNSDVSLCKYRNCYAIVKKLVTVDSTVSTDQDETVTTEAARDDSE